jgi:two-component system chemotaxis response regulator CheY
MKTCMIVDDSKIVRKVTRRMVENLEYAVVEAEDGEEALRVFVKHQPSLILLDWHMPVMDGLAFLRVLRGGTPGGEVPTVIFCTTETDIGHIQEAMLSGANEYVMKPYDEEILKGKLIQLGLL